MTGFINKTVQRVQDQQLCQPASVWLCLLAASLLLINSPSAANCQDKPVKYGPWKTYLGGNSKAAANQPKFEVLQDFELTGAHSKHPFRLNEVLSDGTWGMSKGALQQTGGRSAVLKFPAVEQDFELEMGMNAEGDGGWFILVGYQEGHCYGLYNVTMRTSGSPWFLSEFRGNMGIENTDREVARYQCRGNEPLKLKVEAGKLTLQIDRRVLVDQEELPNYQGGEILIGTYDTTYGPKPLKLYGIRIRDAAAAQ
jgi:hypothetical protein